MSWEYYGVILLDVVWLVLWTTSIILQSFHLIETLNAKRLGAVQWSLGLLILTKVHIVLRVKRRSSNNDVLMLIK